MKKSAAFAIILTISFFLLACAAEAVKMPTIASPMAATPTEIVPTSTPLPTLTPAPAIYLPANLPHLLANSIAIPPGYQLVNDIGLADYVASPGTPGRRIANWRYVLVAPFPSLIDSISLDTLTRLWQGSVSDDTPFTTLLVDETSLFMLNSLLGNPSQATVQTIASTEISQLAWQDPDYLTWAIIPFEELQPTWKIIKIDQASPFSAEDYPLDISVSIKPDLNIDVTQPQNFSPEKLTTLNITGVTALVRSTASLMERNGLLYPAEEIGDLLRSADFTHISNEVSFSPDCPPPRWVMEDLIFCSQPEYIELLQYIEANIIELSGDHLDDWGREAFEYTLALYREKGMFIYGGGDNLTQAQQPLFLEHNGNRLMLIGCNAKHPGYAKASATYPGTWFCDWQVLETAISDALENGYLPIVSIHHKEYDQRLPTDEMVNDFRRLAQYGAVIVVGSQAHQPHTMEFYQNAFIHYGLGNLFFDQYNESFNHRQAFIDRFTFYDNRLVNIELFTTVFVDWAKPRFMTAEERSLFLAEMFSLSQWDFVKP